MQDLIGIASKLAVGTAVSAAFFFVLRKEAPEDGEYDLLRAALAWFIAGFITLILWFLKRYLPAFLR